MVIWNAIVFYEVGNYAEGYFFYNGENNNQYGKIFSVNGLTLSKAIELMKENGVDPIANFKMNIASYYRF